MINFSKDYKNLYNNFIYYDKEKINKIFLIFEGKGGSQTITKDIIPKTTHIQDFIILNSEMERALRYVITQIIRLSQDTQQTSSFLFYFSQYGGSKTQFIRLVESELLKLAPSADPTQVMIGVWGETKKGIDKLFLWSIYLQ